VAETIEAAEDRIRVAVRGGMRLDDARKQFKYHQLQTREST
jgi:4-hydroxy-4-methyl-2-oxoglutarate aldolase